ncbi:hypothetical protein CHS0354_020694 [Potamilus streckersoni]|uniref:Uncharacterized protein n=1 Tax=Potamilus streckersoni TaxID=2493646 RepID=A0AAE0WBZ4_9BIVA|nr:hypothetical protein CHS0354_020694 [Potamilus streckersoni]
MEMNESCLNNLKPQVSRLTDKIGEIKKKINAGLDELERNVTTEVNRIYKQEVIRKQEENHQCLSLIHAVKNSHYLLEAVHKYGSNLQNFLIVEQMRSQLHSYCNLVGEKYEQNDTISVEMKISPKMQSILSISLSELGKDVSTAISNIRTLTCSHRPPKDCPIEIVNVIDLKGITVHIATYTCITFLPGDKVMLSDSNNNLCILLGSSYQFITSHTLTGVLWNVCVGCYVYIFIN